MNDISIIIPVLNEASRIEATIASIRNEAHQIIVVDGGSSDNTPEIARNAGATLLNSLPGRGLQMNRGAQLATGDILLFLHGDTLLLPGWSIQVQNALADKTVIAGSFLFRIDENSLKYRVVEYLANSRSIGLQLPYGDQGLFLAKQLFTRLGGFPETAIMEDFAFALQLRKMGSIRTLRFPAITSGRRWKELGVFRTTLINQIMIIGYYIGVSPNILADFYRRKR